MPVRGWHRSIKWTWRIAHSNRGDRKTGIASPSLGTDKEFCSPTGEEPSKSLRCRGQCNRPEAFSHISGHTYATNGICEKRLCECNQHRDENCCLVFRPNKNPWRDTIAGISLCLRKALSQEAFTLSAFNGLLHSEFPRPCRKPSITHRHTSY
jgi:hypothetical protein